MGQCWSPSTSSLQKGTAMASHALAYLSAAQLVRLQTSPKLAIIDVRDEERSYDGHIAGSWHFASDTFEEQLPNLVEKIQGRETLVFHCAKSQVRGPTCARRLTEHIETLMSAKGLKDFPKIYVLEGGFNGWAGGGKPVCHCSETTCKVSQAL